jgi:hypothetical protein
MNLEEQILEELGTKMQSTVDREILWGILIGMGWTRVKLSRFIDNYHAVDITYWIDKHVKNPFERAGADFIFENSYDAMLFILKWKDAG